MKKILASVGIIMLAVGGINLGKTEKLTAVPTNEEQIFAHVDPISNTVDSVIVITPETLATNGGWNVDGVFKPQSEWIQTSTKGTVRKNFAGKGFKYDKTREAFIEDVPTDPDSVFNEEKARWEKPKYKCDGASTICHY